MNKMNKTVVVDGVTYTAQPTGNSKIVILQRGWVMVGKFSRTEDMCSLDYTQVIRNWGTTKGIGELVNGPTAKTVLEPVGHVEFHILTTVAIITVGEGQWAHVL